MKSSIFVALFFLCTFHSSQAQEAMLGEIKLFAGNFAPRGWAFCHGQIMSITSHSALFSILGTTYGGDGRTTFQLPDLRGRVPIGQGIGPGLSSNSLGQRGGSETNTLSVSQLPPHSHTTRASAGEQQNFQEPMPGHRNVISTEHESNGTTTTSKTGAGSPVNNMQPYTTLNYIICIDGIYPSRN